MDTQRLKDKILQLAIQGKLVEQDKNDEPASELLQRIKEERDKLIKEKKIRKPKKLPPIEEDEKPFEIPEGWEWVRLEDITHSGTLNDGDWIVSKDMNENGNVRLLQLGSIGYGKYINKGFKYITEETFKRLNCREIKEGDILINRLLRDNMCVCELPSIEGKVITTVDTCFIRVNDTIYNSKYLLYLFLSKYFQDRVFERASGTTRQRISKGNLITIPFPLPPLAEQKRIVEKVDELFALIDELDSNKEDLLEVINLTRNQVLQEAIQGKLVEQNPEDEPASVLIQRIKEERDKLVREGKIRKPKKLPPIKEEEKPFAIPGSWEWVRLGETVKLQSGSSPTKYDVSNKGKYMFIKVGDMNLLQNKKEIFVSSQFTDKYIPTDMISEYSIIFPKRGGAISTNKKRIVRKNIYIDTNTMAITPYSKDIFNYVRIWFNNIDLWKLNSGTAVPQINNKDIEPLTLPLPPLAEQKRIVKKVDMIMNMLDELESQLTN